MSNDFIIQKPSNIYLQSVVDYYFFIDISVDELKLRDEQVMPFPRITFGYFFDHPFLATNHSLNDSLKTNMVISRLSTNKISVEPLTDRVRIIGAHLRPYALALLTNKNISKLPWLVETIDLFPEEAALFKCKIDSCKNTGEMFKEVEKTFLNTILTKDLSGIIAVIEIIEEASGNIEISELSKMVGISDRTLRNYFYKNVGCSPKEYIQLLRLKQSIYQMKNSEDNLTEITYSQNFSDQAHFTKSIKNNTGLSPKELQKKIPDFRFLQF